MLEALRELIFIMVGGLLIIALTILIMTLLTIFALVRSTKKAFRTTMNDTINPALNEFQATAQNIKGTSKFVSKKTISPIIQLLALLNGIGKGISFITTFGRKK
ncbi:MAG: hypothetical protein CL779_01680 [Chloroflexi bacterium]|nr:hypothetical protein [Chloroflexota bacterium]|tara:strand:+ start:1044 stop:1355 length:312 start_codon:yes stop_codon:yes gene_type:complete